MATRLTRWPALLGGCLLFGAATLYHGAPGPRIAGTAMLSSNRRWMVWDSLRIVERALDRARIGAGEYHAVTPAPGQLAGVREDDPHGRVLPAPAEWLTPYREGLARLPAHAAEVGTVVRFEGVLDDRFIPPAAGDPAPCFVRGWESSPGDPVDPAGALGPCGYYAAFGRPGPRVGAWMASSYQGYAAAPPGWTYRPDSSSWEQQQLREWKGNSWTMRVARAGLPPAYFGAMNAAGCLVGRTGRCTEAVLAVRPGRPWIGFQDDGLGPLDVMVLPDLVSQFGVARFRAFWKSEADVPAAFAEAFGVPMDEWVREEARSYFGPLDAGAGDVGRAAVTAIGWSALLLLVTAGLARRLRY